MGGRKIRRLAAKPAGTVRCHRNGITTTRSVARAERIGTLPQASNRE
jgi:hypothetical protein